MYLWCYIRALLSISGYRLFGCLFAIGALELWSLGVCMACVLVILCFPASVRVMTIFMISDMIIHDWNEIKTGLIMIYVLTYSCDAWGISLGPQMEYGSDLKTFHMKMKETLTRLLKLQEKW